MAKGAENRLGEKGVVSGTITVLGGGIVGASTVWIALEEAARSLGRNIANETVYLVHHR
jgi:alanine dehydrogenase